MVLKSFIWFLLGQNESVTFYASLGVWPKFTVFVGLIAKKVIINICHRRMNSALFCQVCNCLIEKEECHWRVRINHQVHYFGQQTVLLENTKIVWKSDTTWLSYESSKLLPCWGLRIILYYHQYREYSIGAPTIESHEYLMAMKSSQSGTCNVINDTTPSIAWFAKHVMF